MCVTTICTGLVEIKAALGGGMLGREQKESAIGMVEIVSIPYLQDGGFAGMLCTGRCTQRELRGCAYLVTI